MKQLLSLLFLVWFIASIGLMIYFARSSEMKWLVTVMLGQYLFVFGLLGAVPALRSGGSGWWLGFVSVVTGAAVCAVSVIYHYSDDKELILSFIPTGAGAVMLLAGCTGLAAQRHSARRRRLTCTIPVYAVCVRHNSHYGSGGKQLYSPVYQATVGGVLKELESDTYSNAGVPQIGETRTVYLNDSGDDWYDPEFDKKTGMILSVILACFAVGGLVTVIVSIVNR